MFVVIPSKEYELNFDSEIRNKWYSVFNAADGTMTLNNIYSNSDFMSTIFSQKLIMDSSYTLLFDKNVNGVVNYAKSNNLKTIPLLY